jgi:imidazole glycerol-phosphate synthase subunit HisH
MDEVKKIKVAIIDYQMSNLFSVKHACDFVGLDSKITSDKKEILESDAAILPGVGAFQQAMKNLDKLDLILPIKDFIQSGKPFLGICLGMQLLFSESEEFGICKGLDLIKGKVVKFGSQAQTEVSIKVPQIGWNQISRPEERESWQNTPYANISDGEYMYFVHSFYTIPSNKEDMLSITEYEGTKYCSSILSNNIFATQFHPEKSAREGIKIYFNWSSTIKA